MYTYYKYYKYTKYIPSTALFHKYKYPHIIFSVYLPLQIIMKRYPVVPYNAYDIMTV